MYTGKRYEPAPRAPRPGRGNRPPSQSRRRAALQSLIRHNSYYADSFSVLKNPVLSMLFAIFPPETAKSSARNDYSTLIMPAFCRLFANAFQRRAVNDDVDRAAAVVLRPVYPSAISLLLESVKAALRDLGLTGGRPGKPALAAVSRAK